MGVNGIDYSGARPSDSLIKSHGYVFVIRYLTAPGDKRELTKAELDGHLAAGLSVCLVDEEGNGDRWRQGYQAGHVDGSNSSARARALGWPKGATIYAAADTDIPPSALTTAGEYWRGFRDGLGSDYLAGAYGGKLIIAYVKMKGYVTHTWSSNATSWDHGSEFVPDIQQHFSSHPPIPDTDEDTALSVDYGQVPLHNTPKDDDVPAYSSWPDSDKWEEAVSNSNLVTGEDVEPGPDGTYVGQRPTATNSKILSIQAHQEQILAAILTKLDIPFTWDQGAIKLSS